MDGCLEGTMILGRGILEGTMQLAGRGRCTYRVPGLCGYLWPGLTFNATGVSSKQ